MEVNGVPKQPGYKLINLQKYIPLSVDENKNIISFYFKCKKTLVQFENVSLPTFVPLHKAKLQKMYLCF